jgi:hypothetical protein
MTPRKRLDGELASWHPHPKEAPASLAPVVSDANAADDLSDRFFDSAPALCIPEPSIAIEVSPKRTALDSAKVRARRRYLMRYVAGAVGLASLIGFAAVFRVTTAGDANAAEGFAAAHAATVAVTDPVQTTSVDLPAVNDPPAVAAAVAAPEAIALAPSSPDPAPAAEAPTEPAHALAAAVEPSPAEPAPGDPAEPAHASAATVDDTSDEAPPAQPAHAAAPVTRAEVHSAAEAKRLSLRALDRGRLTAAIEAGEQSVALDPTDADAWLILGAAYEKQGHYSQARKCFTRCSKRAKHGARGECRALLR